MVADFSQFTFENILKLYFQKYHIDTTLKVSFTKIEFVAPSEVPLDSVPFMNLVFHFENGLENGLSFSLPVLLFKDLITYRINTNE